MPCRLIPLCMNVETSEPANLTQLAGVRSLLLLYAEHLRRPEAGLNTSDLSPPLETSPQKAGNFSSSARYRTTLDQTDLCFPITLLSSFVGPIFTANFPSKDPENVSAFASVFFCPKMVLSSIITQLECWDNSLVSMRNLSLFLSLCSLRYHVVPPLAYRGSPNITFPHGDFTTHFPLLSQGLYSSSAQLPHIFSTVRVSGSFHKFCVF